MDGSYLETNLFFVLASVQQFDEILQSRVALGAKHTAKTLIVFL
jgi:hypothetical protein